MSKAPGGWLLGDACQPVWGWGPWLHPAVSQPASSPESLTPTVASAVPAAALWSAVVMTPAQHHPSPDAEGRGRCWHLGRCSLIAGGVVSMVEQKGSFLLSHRSRYKQAKITVMAGLCNEGVSSLSAGRLAGPLLSLSNNLISSHLLPKQ